MRAILILLVHLLSRAVTLLGTGGARAVLAENLLLRHQLLVLRRNRQRAPRLSLADRLLLGFGASFLNPRRLLRTAIILRPATLLRLHSRIYNDRRVFSLSSVAALKIPPSLGSLK